MRRGRGSEQQAYDGQGYGYERQGYEGALPRWGRHEADAARYEGAVPPMLVPSAQPLPPVAARRPPGARANLHAYYVAQPKRA